MELSANLEAISCDHASNSVGGFKMYYSRDYVLMLLLEIYIKNLRVWASEIN